MSQQKSLPVLLVFLFLFSALAQGQQSKGGEKNKINDLGNKVTKKVRGLLYQSRGDTVMDEESESAFMRYQGRTIRKITIRQIGFERNINDTTKRKVVNNIARLGNTLHTTTKDQVIRNNLFIKEGNPLDPYKLADNERFLRDRNFILDARILVKPVKGNRELVDLIVITRDVFSIGGSFEPSSSNSAEFQLYDVNLGGLGQRAQFSGLVDNDRDPRFGYQLLYSKNSIKGTFVNATVSFTQLNTGASYGLENESALFVKLDRPLVSPYSRWAGGTEFSRNWSANTFNVIDTSFRKYTYYIKDFWIGYNIGVKNRVTNRNRHFVGIRAFQQQFGDPPNQNAEARSLIYNNQTYILGEFTFYNQNFFRTKYVYGFGRTEDVPYGRRLTIFAGEVKQLGYTRPYVGADFEKSFFLKSGDFGEYSLRAGGFKQNREIQDVTLLASASLFSKLIPWKGFKVRQSARLNYTAIVNQTISTPLQIDNEFGVQKFFQDSLVGTKRLGIGVETLLFIRPTLLGFHFAPFIFTDMALVAPKNESLFKQKAYFGLGGGIRTRNENLIFGTIELRMFYFPRITEDLSKFKITISSNLRVKFSSGFVKAPAFINYN